MTLVTATVPRRACRIDWWTSTLSGRLGKAAKSGRYVLVSPNNLSLTRGTGHRGTDWIDL